MRPISLYKTIGTDKDGNEMILMDIHKSEERDLLHVEDHLLYEEVMEKINDFLEREREIFLLRYGIGNGMNY